MQEVTIKDITKLREATGLGIMDVKKALVEAGGDHEKALDALRKSGALKAAKKAERQSNNGIVDAYIHGEGKIGVLVEVTSETDFVAKNQDFKDFVHEIALHIAAADPKYISRDEVPKSELDKEKSIFAEQLKTEGKPENMIEKIVAGKVEKLYSEICLLDQPYVKDPDRKVSDLLTDNIAKIGENITVKRFARFTVGC